MKGFPTRIYKLSIGHYGLCFILFLLAACGSSSDNAGTSDSGTGSITFSIAVSDSPSERGDIHAASIDCEAEGISTVEAAIYDQSDNLLKTGAWDCSLHSGTIKNVPIGDNRSLTLSGKDAGGNSIYTGSTTSAFTVAAGQTTNVGEIAMDRILNCNADVTAFMDIMIGDDDGYGYGVEDYSDLPTAPANDQFCFGSDSACSFYDNMTDCEANSCTWATWIFDNRSLTEMNAADGSQHTDYTPFSGRSFSFTFNFTPPINPYDSWIWVDVSGIQSAFGASSLFLDGVDYSSMLPTDQGVFGSELTGDFIDTSLLQDGSVTVSFEGGQLSGGDAIAFDYFSLEIKVPDASIMLLLGSSLLGLGVFSRKRKRS